MKLELNQDGICLKRKQLLKVRRGAGYAIVCQQGSVWVTQDGDARDIILGAGESFAFDRNGAALVQALESSAVSFARSALASGVAYPLQKPDRASWSRARAAAGV